MFAWPPFQERFANALRFADRFLVCVCIAACIRRPPALALALALAVAAAGACGLGFDNTVQCFGTSSAGVGRRVQATDLDPNTSPTESNSPMTGRLLGPSRDLLIVILPCEVCPYGSIDDGVSTCCVPCLGGTWAANASQCIPCGE